MIPFACGHDALSYEMLLNILYCCWSCRNIFLMPSSSYYMSIVTMLKLYWMSDNFISYEKVILCCVSLNLMLSFWVGFHLWIVSWILPYWILLSIRCRGCSIVDLCQFYWLGFHRIESVILHFSISLSLTILFVAFFLNISGCQPVMTFSLSGAINTRTTFEEQSNYWHWQEGQVSSFFLLYFFILPWFYFLRWLDLLLHNTSYNLLHLPFFHSLDILLCLLLISCSFDSTGHLWLFC